MLEMRRDNRSLRSTVRQRAKAIGGEKYLCGEFTALLTIDVFSYAWLSGDEKNLNPLWTTWPAPNPAADRGFDFHGCCWLVLFREASLRELTLFALTPRLPSSSVPVPAHFCLQWLMADGSG